MPKNANNVHLTETPENLRKKLLLISSILDRVSNLLRAAALSLIDHSQSSSGQSDSPSHPSVGFLNPEPPPLERPQPQKLQ